MQKHYIYSNKIRLTKNNWRASPSPWLWQHGWSIVETRGMLFHRRTFSSEQNNTLLQPFTRLETWHERSAEATIILFDIGLKRRFTELYFQFEDNI